MEGENEKSRTESGEGNWYLGIRHGNFRPMAGPYRTRQEADAVLGECQRLASQIDPYTWIMTWETARFRHYDKPGRLNHLLGR
jgi:hypothetical protein